MSDDDVDIPDDDDDDSDVELSEDELREIQAKYGTGSATPSPAPAVARTSAPAETATSDTSRVQSDDANSSDTPTASKKKSKKKTSSPAHVGEPTRWDQVIEEEDDFSVLGFNKALLDTDDPFMYSGEYDYDYAQYLEDLEDPLGITPSKGLKRVGKLTLRTLAKKKKTNLRMNGLDLTADNYNPRRYLAVKHKDTPMDQLLAGKSQLEKKVTSRQRQLEVLVKENFPRFVSCKDAVDEIYAKIETQRRTEGSSTTAIETTEDTVKDLIKKSHDLFDRLLNRQAEVDKIRNVLSILKRSQFIFNLPRRMRENIAKGEYTKVVLNYKKVKSVIALAVHSSIKKIVLEVEAIIKDLREQLFQSLDRPGATLREQEETIRLLVELAPPIDPAWHVIHKRAERMKELLSQKKAPIAITASNLAPPQRDHAGQPPRSPSTARHLGYSLQLPESSSRAQAFAILQFSNVVMENLPDLWHLAKSFFTGEYHKSLSEKRRKEILDLHPDEEFGALVKDIMKMYAECVTKNFTGEFTDFKKSVAKAKQGSTSARKQPGSARAPGTRRKGNNTSKTQSKPTRRADESPRNRGPAPRDSDDPTRFVLPDDEEDTDKEKVVAVLRCWKTITELGIPPIHYTAVTDLLDHLTRVFTTQTFSIVFSDLKLLYAEEDWEIVDHHHSVTSLPYILDAMLKSVLAELDGIIQPDDPIIVYIQRCFADCIKIFADNMHHLAFVASGPSELATLPTPDNMNIDYTSLFVDENRASGSPDIRLLITLNNCQHVRSMIVPDIMASFQKSFNRKLVPFPETATHLYEELEDMILRKYIRIKTLSVTALIKNGLLFTGYDWGTQTAPMGIRDYVMTVLLHLVFIHDELFRFCKNLVNYALQIMLENIYQCYLDSFEFIDNFSTYGLLQVGMELDFIAGVMTNYKTDISNNLFKEIDAILGYKTLLDSPEFPLADKKLVKNILTNKRTNTELLFECFVPFTNLTPETPKKDMSPAM